jgi:hypothetical protein
VFTDSPVNREQLEACDLARETAAFGGTADIPGDNQNRLVLTRFGHSLIKGGHHGSAQGGTIRCFGRLTVVCNCNEKAKQSSQNRNGAELPRHSLSLLWMRLIRT